MHARHINVAQATASDTGKTGPTSGRGNPLDWPTPVWRGKSHPKGKRTTAWNVYFINLRAGTCSMPSSVAPWFLSRISGLSSRIRRRSTGTSGLAFRHVENPCSQCRLESPIGWKTCRVHTWLVREGTAPSRGSSKWRTSKSGFEGLPISMPRR